MRRPVWLSALLALAASCGPSGPARTGTGQPLIDGTFTIALAGDPGNLDPHHSATFAPAFVLAFAYEGLAARGPDGRLHPNLAESWEQSPDRIRFTLRRNLTCADGTPLTLADVADNYRYVLDPANHSTHLGDGGLPRGTRLEVDEAARTLTLRTAALYSFLLEMTGMLPIVCRRGLADRARLRHHTEGTGLFRLTGSVSNSHYAFARRADHHWSPWGTRSDTPGLPRLLNIRIIPNQTTGANLLLAGELSAASISGPDRRRVEAAGFQAFGSRGPGIQMWFNQAPGRITGDEAVRRALIAAIDRPLLARIASAGLGMDPHRLAGAEPMACAGNTVDAVPLRFDMVAANRLLDRAGWRRGADGIRIRGGRRLSLSLIWDYDLNDPTSSAYAAEYAVSQWHALGAEVRARSVNGAGTGEVLFGTGDYDISWVPIVVSLPSRFVRFVSGPTPPQGLNFPHAAFPEVERLTAAANAIAGAASCPSWDAVERLYLTRAAVMPVFDSDYAILSRDARFAVNGLMVVPASIRMIG